MRYGHIPGIAKSVSRLVQGTLMIESREEARSFALLDEIFALGCTTFDTAHDYGNGDNERTFGRWLRERGVRDMVVIVGKGAHHRADRRRVTPADITADLLDSLARFEVTTIDLYLLHRDDPAVPVGPIVEVLNEHHRAGRIQAFGGSNWSHERIAAANDYARQHGLVPFVASSPQFSLADQVQAPWENTVSISGESGRPAQAWYAAEQMAVLPWSSLAGGFFSGRFTRASRESCSGYFDQLCMSSYGSEANFQRLERAAALAAEKGLTPAQVALAYVLNQPMKVFAVVGCHRPTSFRSSLEALDVRLTPEEMAWLESGERGGRSPS